MSSQEEKVWVEPELDEQGRLVYKAYTRPDAENAEVYLAKVPVRVIPVIFVPGVMGSNLQSLPEDKTDKLNKIWRLDGVLTLLPWIFKDAKTRRNLLEPNAVQIDPRGKVRRNNKEKKYFASRRERGWGEVGRFNYGNFLHWLQGELLEIGQSPSAKGKSFRHQWRQGHIVYPDDKNFDSKNNIAAATEKLLELTGDEVSLSARYLLPLHAFGYNWLASNADSAQRLADKVEEIIDSYRAKGHKCEKVILVTHSMGGLVARHYSENLGGKDNILGVLHGVIPARGAATAYQRMKMGMGLFGLKGFFTNQIIGKDAEEMTVVMAQSPGPLQLLPGTEYGTGWLKIKEQGATHCLPVSDPYDEIYMNREEWWNLCDSNLINPEVKVPLESDWIKYSEVVEKVVNPFIEELREKYHSNTHAFYGTGHPTYEEVVWQQQSKHELKFVAACSAAGADTDVLGAKQARTNRDNKKSIRKIRLLDSDENTISQDMVQTFKLVSANSSGDGTVAVRSAELKAVHCQSQLAVNMLEHEPAYDDKRSREYTMAAIIKIIQAVKKTGLSYD